MKNYKLFFAGLLACTLYALSKNSAGVISESLSYTSIQAF